MRLVRLIAINLVLVLGLVLGVSLLCAIMLDVKSEMQHLRNEKDAIAPANSPAYPDRAYGEQVLRETQKSAVFDFYPFIEWRRRPYSGKTVNVDSDGLRHQAHTDPRAAHKVAFFGASATWGSGVDDAATVPSQFEKMATGFTAINYAEGGYNSRQDLNNFLSLTETGQSLDWAVFIEGVGDVAALCAPGVSLNTQGQEARMRQIIAQSTESSVTIELLIGPLRRILAGLHHPGASGMNETCASSPERAAAVAGVLIEHWKVDRMIAQSHGIKPLIVLQPVAYIGNPRTDYLPDAPADAAQYTSVYRKIHELAQAQNIDWIEDFTHIADGTKPLFVDRFHMNPEGNRIVARKLAAMIAGGGH